jgi:hypothetical protein
MKDMCLRCQEQQKLNVSITCLTDSTSVFFQDKSLHCSRALFERFKIQSLLTQKPQDIDQKSQIWIPYNVSMHC